MAILISDKIEFKKMHIFRGKKEHFIIIEESMHQEEITMTNVYALDNRVQNYMKQNLNSWEKIQFTLIVGDFNKPLSVIDITVKQKNK